MGDIQKYWMIFAWAPSPKGSLRPSGGVNAESLCGFVSGAGGGAPHWRSRCDRAAAARVEAPLDGRRGRSWELNRWRRATLAARSDRDIMLPEKGHRPPRQAQTVAIDSHGIRSAAEAADISPLLQGHRLRAGVAPYGMLDMEDDSRDG